MTPTQRERRECPPLPESFTRIDGIGVIPACVSKQDGTGCGTVLKKRGVHPLMAKVCRRCPRAGRKS